MPAVADDLLTEVAPAEGGVAGDRPPVEDHALEQGQGRLVLVGLGGDAGLGQDAAGVLVQGREQVHRLGVGRAAAARGLAVDRHGVQLAGAGGRQQVGDPSRDGGLERPGIEPGEEALEGAVARGPATVAQPVHQLDGLVAAPLGDGGIAPASAEHGAAGLGQHGEQGVAATGSSAWVGHIGEEGQQATGLGLGNGG